MSKKITCTDGESSLTLCTQFGYIPQCNSSVRVLTSILLLSIAASSGLLAQAEGSSVTQSVTIEVKPITKISVTGDPNPLIINDAVAGSNLTSVSDANTKYSLTTNLDNMKIVASISDKMPVGTRLTVNLSSSRGESAGTVDLSSAVNPVDVVTGISRCSEVNQSINYTFAANAEVSQIPTQTRTITLTLTN